MEVAPKQPSLLDLSTAIAPWTHIQQIRLLKSSIEVKIGDATAPSPVQHIFDATTEFNSETDTLAVRTCLAVSAGEFLHIAADFTLDYQVDKSLSTITPEGATAFGKVNGIHNIWPYWREYVHSTTMRAGFPPLVIPLLTVGAMLAHYAEKEKAAISQDSGENSV